jgi:hypothetical protein
MADQGTTTRNLHLQEMRVCCQGQGGGGEGHSYSQCDLSRASSFGDTKSIVSTTPSVSSTPSSSALSQFFGSTSNSPDENNGSQQGQVEAEEEDNDDDDYNAETEPGAVAMRQRINQVMLDGRAKNTDNAYGNNFAHPERSNGALGEFYKWCKAGPNVAVNNLVTLPSKVSFKSCDPTEIRVAEYFDQHLLKRKTYNPVSRQFEVDKPLGNSGLVTAYKALNSFYLYRANRHKGGMDGYRKKFGPPPKENKNIKLLIAGQRKALAKNRREKHLPRGKAALALEGYTEDQNRQLLSLG